MKITHNGILYAVVVKKEYVSSGVEFLTGNEELFQAGFLTREKGYQAPLHSHNAFSEPITSISEFIMVRSGKVQVILMSEEKELIEKIILEAGDFVIHFKGLHEVTFLEDSQIFEIKQGPYHGAESKTFYEMGNA